MLNISKVVCMLLKHFAHIWTQSPIYRQHYAYKLVCKAYHKCMYTAQHTIHFGFNFSLPIECVWKNFNRGSSLNGSYSPESMQLLILGIPYLDYRLGLWCLWCLTPLYMIFLVYYGGYDITWLYVWFMVLMVFSATLYDIPVISGQL